MRVSSKMFWTGRGERGGIRKNSMRISVITAVYNGGISIADTLNSVAQQDHDAIEHIVIDGGSVDCTLATVRLHDKRVARLISERDKGIYDAFNKGLRVATGDAVAFLNCGDTYVSPTVVTRMVKELSRDGIQAAFGDVSIVDAADKARIVRRYSSKRFTPRRMALGLMPAHPTLFLRREVFQSVGEYDTRFRIAGDFELCLRVFACRETRYRYVPEPLVLMPRGGLSNQGWRSKWEITREMQQACAMNNVNTNFVKLCLRFPLKLLEMI
jgi:glycosyltransferase involved in cell wall biosynthesis